MAGCPDIPDVTANLEDLLAASILSIMRLTSSAAAAVLPGRGMGPARRAARHRFGRHVRANASSCDPGDAIWTARVCWRNARRRILRLVAVSLQSFRQAERRHGKVNLRKAPTMHLLRATKSCTKVVIVPEHGGDGNGTELVKRNGDSLQLPLRNGDSGFSTELSFEHAGRKFKVAAYGLWGAGAAVIALMVIIQAWIPAALPMMWLLGVIAGGLLATGTTHGRLADNRFELARVRAELDRKAVECSKLVARIIKNPQSSRGRGKKNREERR